MSRDDINSIKSNILDAIHDGKVTMRPRWHFVLISILIILGAILAFLSLLFMVSFIIFALRESGIWFAPVFGGRGWFSFFRSLPWLLIAFALLFIAVLEIMVRRFSFGYRQPLLYSALGIIAVTMFGSVIIAQTSFHRFLFRAAQNGDLPLFGELYRGFGAPEIPDLHVGVIQEFSETGFTLQSRHGKSHLVVLNATTTFPLGTDFAKGDLVIVIGDEVNGVIQALGVRVADPSMDFPPGIPPVPGERHGARLHFLP